MQKINTIIIDYKSKAKKNQIYAGYYGEDILSIKPNVIVINNYLEKLNIEKLGY